MVRKKTQFEAEYKQTSLMTKGVMPVNEALMADLAMINGKVRVNGHEGFVKYYEKIGFYVGFRGKNQWFFDRYPEAHDYAIEDGDDLFILHNPRKNASDHSEEQCTVRYESYPDDVHKKDIGLIPKYVLIQNDIK
jgi:hypothetical protein